MQTTPLFPAVRVRIGSPARHEVFGIVGAVHDVMKRAGLADAAEEFVAVAMRQRTYEAMLDVVRRTVAVVD